MKLPWRRVWGAHKWQAIWVWPHSEIFCRPEDMKKCLLGASPTPAGAVSYDLCGIILRQSLLCNGGRFNMLSCIFIKNPAFSCS